MAAQPAPLTERKYVLPFVLITSLFFLWAFGVNLNDVLIPHFKSAFSLSDFQSSFIQVAFFGGYSLAALVAGRLMERIGYRRGILSGLFLCAAGAFLFVPAGSLGVYGLFLLSSFVLACGQSFLEVAANPYATTLGAPGSSERRLNLAQSFNAVGAVVALLVVGPLILSATVPSASALAGLSPAALQAYRASQTATVRIPYLVIGGIFLLVAALIYFAHLPEIREPASSEEAGASASWSGVLSHKHLVRGVIAQFLYVGAQVGVGSFVIRFVMHAQPFLGPRAAARYLQLHLVGFMIGRFTGSALMKSIRASRLLAFFALGALLCAVIATSTRGAVPIYAVVLIGFFHSIMFPTIFALGIKNLGPFTKRGSSLLVMAILGAAVVPPIMGKISDLSNIQRAFLVPLLCYAYVLYFAVAGYQPKSALVATESAPAAKLP
ncbi:MAG TPA: L-fucose:H+ symporter permease [Candidatus Sulfotelmatobacter sp.]|nr:L-fucose:H+ symporter permease [Candidatus Sulfotelmatobacter sp.]